MKLEIGQKVTLVCDHYAKNGVISDLLSDIITVRADDGMIFQFDKAGHELETSRRERLGLSEDEDYDFPECQPYEIKQYSAGRK